MNERETVFRYFGLDDHAKELIAMACAHAPWVELAPLDKGLSGSMVLMARWSVSGAMSKFHVFKIGDPAKLGREHHAINTVAAPLVRNFPHAALHVSGDKARALLSQEFLGDSDGSTRSLRQYIEKADAETKVIEILRRLYEEGLIDWHSKSIDRQETSVREELNSWIKKGDFEKACNQIGSAGIAASLRSRYGLDLGRLHTLVNRILGSPLAVDKGPVHGDLHSQNVLVDQRERISLIDFGWTAVRWRALDYLWLECSLKFVVASPYANIDDLLAVEDLLDNAWTSKTAIDVSSLEGRLHSLDLKKIAAGVALIREQARSHLPHLTLTEYRKGLIAMSYALTTFPELNLVYLMHSLARNAQLIEPELDEEGPYHALYKGSKLLWPSRAGRMVKKAAIASSPGRALDIGCGDGKNLVFLEDQGWEVTGVDINSLAVSGARKRYLSHFGQQSQMRGRVDRADAVTYNYPTEEYDLVVAYGLYHCLDDKSLHRVHDGALACLKPSGLFAFAALNDQMPIPDGHCTGDLFLRHADHIFDLANGKFDVVEREVGKIVEDHPPMVGKHEHSLTWALLRKK